MTTELECNTCGQKCQSTEVELTNLDITDEYFRIIGTVQNVMLKD